MNTKRKADLQRKLTLAPVPKPPAGLAQQIKKDIPENLFSSPEADRARLSRSVGFSLRVAASVLLMISSVYLVLQLLSRTTPTPTQTPYAQSAERKKSVQVAEAPAAATAAAQPAIVADRRNDELTTSRAQTQAQPPASNQLVYAPERPSQLSDARSGAVAQNSPSREEPAFPTAPPQTPAARSAAAESVTVVAEAPAIARDSASQGFAAPPPAPAAAQNAEQATARADGASASSATGAIMSKTAAAPTAPQPARMAAAAAHNNEAAAAKDLTAETSGTLFGIAVDPGAFARVKQAIQQGRQPASADVDVDAIVNYFAGPAPGRVRALRLEAEISPSVVSQDPQERLVRFTIDAPPSDALRRPVVATDAAVSVEFDPDSVARSSRVGDGAFTTASEAQILAGSSVTALFDLDLSPGVRPGARVATIRLTYRNAAGRMMSSEKVLFVGNSAKSWGAASRRHRLASLGARWAETLKGTAGVAEVAARAAQLSRQKPGDSRARELANAATASSRLQNSGRTGSGR